MRRTEIPEPLADLATWPGVDAGALGAERRTVYLQREEAVRAWLAGASLGEVESNAWAWIAARCAGSSSAASCRTPTAASRACGR